jgi:hypothetical protein
MYPHIETESDYREYCESVAHYMKGLTPSGSGPASCCTDCQDQYDLSESDNWDEVIDEGGFSSASCDCCGRSLGGDRYILHAFDSDDNLYHLEACVDCVYFLEYGRLDDMTMLDISNN